MAEPVQGRPSGWSDEEHRPTSVSSLASRFEQLASGTADNRQHATRTLSSTSVGGGVTPPVIRPKPAASRSQPLQQSLARLGAMTDSRPLAFRSDSQMSTAAAEEVHSHTDRSRLPTPPSQAIPLGAREHKYTTEASASVVMEAQPSSTDESPVVPSRIPPPIPHATRPAPSGSWSQSFLHHLSSPQANAASTVPSSGTTAPQPNRGNTPPPIPAPRLSRPNTPSHSLPIFTATSPPRPEHAASHSHTIPGVTALAARFGHAKPSTSYISPHHESTGQASPETTYAEADLANAAQINGASKALQHIVTRPQSRASSTGHDSVQGITRRNLFESDSDSLSRSRTPPIAVPMASTDTLAPQSAYQSDASDGVSKSAPSVSRASPVPPALPARDRSNSVQRSLQDPFAEPVGLQPPSGRSTSEGKGVRPRAATSFEVRADRHVRRDVAPTVPTQNLSNSVYAPPPPPMRSAPNGATRGDSALGAHGHQFQHNVAQGTMDSSSSESEDEINDDKRIVTEMPDASFANRRPPKISPERNLYAKHAVNAFALHGRYAVSATTHIRVWDTWTGQTTGVVTLQGENKVTSVVFIYTDAERSQDGRIVWAGGKDGNLYEVDIQTMRVLCKTSAHSSPITGIFRIPDNRVITICESGKVQLWSNSTNFDSPPSLSCSPRTQRLGDKHSFLTCFGEQLWSCHGPARHTTLPASQSSNASRSPAVRVYDVQGDNASALTPRTLYVPDIDNGCQVGSVLAGTVIPCQPNLIYLAHETGHITIWDKAALKCIDVVRVSPYAITAMEGVNDLLWAGNREGTISVYDTKHTPWKVAKAWRALDEPIFGLQVDLATLAVADMLHVASYGRESLVMWDGLLEIDWLEHNMIRREPDFCTYRDIKIFITSWNIDSSKPADLNNDAASINFLADALHSSLGGVSGQENPPEVVVFGLQEVVDLEDKKVTAKSMLLGRKKADAMFQDQVSHQYMRWHDRLVQAVRSAMPPSCPYYLLHAENLVGLQTLIFVKVAEKPNISDAAKVSVKTGMGGRYGNKGSILARFVVDDTSICFMNCHLAAGQRATRQRNKDLIDILENKSAFLQPSTAVPGVYLGGDGQTVFEHEICFLSGDLNYRISLTRSIVCANIRSGNLKLLLDHDQLAKEMKNNQAFRLRSFREADINFLPTYKYDPGTDDYDSSAKARIPAWCDRILYRVHEPSLRQDHIKPLSYRSWSATPSDHKPISGLYLVRIKKMNHELRKKHFEEVEAMWKSRAKDMLMDAKRFHGLY